MFSAIKKPELLAPAGNFSKLRTAFAYGADAVYVGSPQFGLRQGADNFTWDELAQGIAWANVHHKKIYVALNAMPHRTEMDRVQDLLKRMDGLQPHGLIISDPGIFSLARQWTSIPCHVSTQASVCNGWTAKMWAEAGAKRVIVARELSLEECLRLKDVVPIEVETFVHGSMCTSYSGKCTISSYTAGRDANRGGCVHNCRYEFEVYDAESGEKEYTTHIMNSRDLMAVSLMPQIFSCKLDSLKIEGRMKSNLYVAQTVRVYRQAIDSYAAALAKGQENQWSAGWHEEQLSHLSNRTFTTGSLEKRAFAESLNYDHGGYSRGWQYVGVVRGSDDNYGTLLEVRAPFRAGTVVDVLRPTGLQAFVCDQLLNVQGEAVAEAKANTLVYIPAMRNTRCDWVCVQRQSDAGADVFATVA